MAPASRTKTIRMSIKMGPAQIDFKPLRKECPFVPLFIPMPNPPHPFLSPKGRGENICYDF
jgi:hypothetical protein